MKKILIIFTLALAMTSCNNSGTGSNSEASTEKNPVELSPDPDDLLGKEWKLLKLNGSEIKLDTSFTKYPYLKFENKDKISGNFGCNSFGARVKFKATDSISIFDLVSTEMACPNLKLEQDFSDALRNTKTFKVDGNTLYLSNEMNTVTAMFEQLSR